jgi:endonuclease/exonuclease/phosphatase family metal-dependent hydrolase
VNWRIRSAASSISYPVMSRIAALLLASIALVGCRAGRSYTDPNGPRYAGPSDDRVRAPASADTLRLISFNIEYAIEMDSAIAVLSEPSLRGADVVMVQEMDEPGTKRLADALGMRYVYYPAIYNLRTQRDFGNAVLTRWPIVGDAKITLPGLSRYARTQRTATAVTLRVGESLVRVYSTHLGTPADIGPAARAEQLRTVIADAAAYDRVIIGGDMNAASVGRIAREMGYAWPTERGPRTTVLGRWDHIFLKGFAFPQAGGAGTVLNVRHASDHRPVWALALLH